MKKARNRGKGEPGYKEPSLFAPAQSAATARRDSEGCEVVAVGKRRDGGTRYWCLRHKADATAKYGKPAKLCRTAHIAPISLAETLELNLDLYKGGVALWGAVPAVYDTTRQPMDRGIHVHARVTRDSPKEMDQTVRALRIFGGRLPEEGVYVSELDAIYYMVSSVFGLSMRQVVVPFVDIPIWIVIGSASTRIFGTCVPDAAATFAILSRRWGIQSAAYVRHAG